MSDLTDMLRDQLTAMNNVMAAGITAGAEGTWIRIGPAIRALERQYREAQADPQAKLPTMLSVAIEGVLQQAAQALPASAYAERRTQRRDGGGDTTVHGEQLEAGR